MPAPSMCWARWRNRTSSGMRPSSTFRVPPNWTPAFGDAFVGLGACLGSAKRFSEAIPPLENAVKLEPENPAPHYLLAIAYSRTGRKEDGDKQFAIQRQLTQKGAAGENNSQSQPNPN